ncbi:MAG: divalent-cation tolerance protein CutA [Bacteroidota bacterium]
MFKNLRLIYITTQDRKEAQHIGQTLVRERLAACVNIIDGMESIYEWNGEIQTESEAILIAKTPYYNVDELTRRVKQLHSYDCPAILSITLTEQEGNEEYLLWLMNQTRNSEEHLPINGDDDYEE